MSLIMVQRNSRNGLLRPEEAVAFGRQGKWGHDEAQGPVREILARCTSVLGEGHYLTAYYPKQPDGAVRQVFRRPLPELARPWQEGI